MKKYLNVMIDTETLSRRPSAAIIQIAAKPFCLDGSEPFKEICDCVFHANINATSCAMYGMDFEKETIDWWTKNISANEEFKYTRDADPIKLALEGFSNQLNEWLKRCGADELKPWCQGTDFDIALMREAYRRVLGSEEKIPWKYRNVRDARTYFLEAAEMFAPDEPNPYSLIETDGEKHHALDDCDWSIKAVQWAYKKIRNQKS